MQHLCLKIYESYCFKLLQTVFIECQFLFLTNAVWCIHHPNTSFNMLLITLFRPSIAQAKNIANRFMAIAALPLWNKLLLDKQQSIWPILRTCQNSTFCYIVTGPNWKHTFSPNLSWFFHFPQPYMPFQL